MKKTAILGNDCSSQKTARIELIDSLHDCGIQPYSGRVWDGELNNYYSKETAIFLPIIANRNNINPLIEIKSIISIARQIKKNRIDSVIIYGVKNHAAMAIGSKIGGAKKILCIVNGRGNLFRLSGVKGILIRLLAFSALRIAYRISTSVCFQNKDDFELFKMKKLIHQGCDCFLTAGSGVNLELFPYKEMPDDNVFLFLSRITPSKGLKEYCEAARMVKSKYPEAMFYVVGPIDATVEHSTFKDNLESSITDGIVEYHGFTKDVSTWMQNCRFFIYPSYYPEGVPRCVLQALSTGRPVITCDSPGCKETVKNGENGFLVKPRDIHSLATKMISLIENKEMAKEMGKCSRILAEEKFDVFKNNQIIIKHLMD